MLKHITIYLCHNALGVSLGLPDVFSVASQAQKKLTGQQMSLELATSNGGPVVTYGGITVAADKAIAEIDDTQLLIMPPLGGELTEDFLDQHLALYEKLRRWHARGVQIVAGGSANFLLAEAGLLDDRMSTANRFTRHKFTQRYPRVDVRVDRLITESEGIYTCTGMQAFEQVMSFQIAQLSSQTVSNIVDNTFASPAVKDSVEHSLSSHQSLHQDEPILKVQHWIELHFAELISLELLADRANMSLRTLKRRFKIATGDAPLRYIQKLRVQQGKEYLKHTKRNVAQISRLVGYEDAGHFNRLFRREYQLTPDQWRQQQNKNRVATAF